MKKTLLFSLTLLAGGAAAAVAQEPPPPPAQQPMPPAQPPADASRTANRQFTGEVLSTDVANKSITVKASGLDASGQRVEKTMSLPVADAVASQLEMLKAGDKVTVLWRRDDAQQRDVIVAITKGEAPPQP
jgi:Cu/Ag efflux protein CusF